MFLLHLKEIVRMILNMLFWELAVEERGWKWRGSKERKNRTDKHLNNAIRPAILAISLSEWESQREL